MSGVRLARPHVGLAAAQTRGLFPVSDVWIIDADDDPGLRIIGIVKIRLFIRGCLGTACAVWALRVLYGHCLCCMGNACAVWVMLVLYGHCLCCMGNACAVWVMLVLYW